MRRFLLPVLLTLGLTSSAAAAYLVAVASPTTTSLTANATACTVPGGASCTVILAKTDLTPWQKVVVSVYVSGANTVDDALVEVSADGTHWTTVATLSASAVGATRTVSFGDDRYKYVRAEGRAAANSQVIVTVTGEQS